MRPILFISLLALITHAVNSMKNQRRLISSFGKYPGYTGNLTVTGSFSMIYKSTTNATFRAHFDLKGLDSACSTGCGIHIHTGTTCSNASLVGGHYWTPTNITDPWDSVFYYASKNGTASGLTSLSSGYNYMDNIGHAVVVHTAGGTRVACGILQATKGNLKAVMGPHPGNTSPYALNGTITVTFLADDSMRMSYNLNGPGDPNCTISPGCGIHIHTGTNCSASAYVGGHYWAPTLSNPWSLPNSRYILRKVGNNSSVYASKGSYIIYNGYNRTSNDGHVAILHKSDGKQIACGVLGR